MKIATMELLSELSGTFTFRLKFRHFLIGIIQSTADGLHLCHGPEVSCAKGQRYLAVVRNGSTRQAEGKSDDGSVVVLLGGGRRLNSRRKSFGMLRQTQRVLRAYPRCQSTW